SVDALRRHYQAVADASPIPVWLYTVPAFTGLPCPPSLPALLAGHPRLTGMKESSGDLGLMGRILSSVPSSFRVACGSAPVLYPALCLGAAAGIVAVACCAPGPATALYRAFCAGDHARARTLQAAITPLATAVTAAYGVAGLKAAIDLAGFRGGEVRPPLLPAAPAVRAELEPLFRAALAAEA
ncbi:MAG TPA: dihydrodipicolinate synthase family protein, partial [Vicinamibacteria bacterium]|nr:dihydrodipicolinate synthase family protein [Vicinamibacteria bacterium]